MKTIEMARRAGIKSPDLYKLTVWPMSIDQLERFSELILADEREIWAKDADWCIQNHLEHLIPERIRARGNK